MTSGGLSWTYSNPSTSSTYWGWHALPCLTTQRTSAVRPEGRTASTHPQRSAMGGPKPRPSGPAPLALREGWPTGEGDLRAQDQPRGKNGKVRVGAEGKGYGQAPSWAGGAAASKGIRRDYILIFRYGATHQPKSAARA